MKVASSLLVLSGMLTLSSAFFHSSVTTTTCSPRRSILLQSSTASTTTATNEATATLLSQYMTKAHEAKLQAVHDAEVKKQMEIDALKQEIARLQQAAAAAAAAPKTITYRERLMALTKEELVERILQYREFMSDYIIKAHEEKFKAVQAAKTAARAQASGTAASTATAATKASAAVPTKKASTSIPSSKSAAADPLFTARNAAVAAAGSDSRWGELEVQRAAAGTGTAAPTTIATTAAAAKAAKATVSIAADLMTEPSLFAARNKIVAVAGTKSRWGAQEVQRVTEGVVRGAAPSGVMAKSTTTTAATAAAAAPVLMNIGAMVAAANGAAVVTSTTTTSPPPPPEVVAADHGLRADGGVGGLTLAERVAMGATAPVVAAANGNTVPPAANGQQHHDIYQERNEMLVAASQAGKSRWSADEVSRIQTKVGSLPSSAVAAKKSQNVDTINGVVAAKVGRLSVHERINLGAAMLA